MNFSRLFYGCIGLFILIGPAGIYAQEKAATSGEAVFKSVDELWLHYSNKIEEARRTIEAQRLVALENYLKNAPAAERRDVLLNILRSAAYLDKFDKVISVTDTILKENPQDPDKWNILSMRFETLMDTGKLDQARKEWEEASATVDMQNWQGIFQTAMSLADRYTETQKVEEVKAVYEALKKKLPFVTDLESLLNMKNKQLSWVGQTPPPIVGTDLDGKKVDWADYRGKVVLLEFWATWCGPCIAQLPHIKQLYTEYHQQGFEIIGISLDNQAATVQTFVKNNQIPWRQLFDGQLSSGANALTYNVSGIPASFLIGPDGKIVMAGEPRNGFESVIQRLLTKKASVENK